MADAGDYTLVFVGMTHTPATGMIAELQALWATAYLDGRIPLGGMKEKMEKEVAEVNVWMKRRYLNLGEKCANLTFEFMPVSFPPFLLEVPSLHEPGLTYTVVFGYAGWRFRS